MPRHEELVLARFELLQRIERLREVLKGHLASRLTGRERADLEATLVQLSRDVARLDMEIAQIGKQG